jgi:hypothetical protein
MIRMLDPEELEDLPVPYAPEQREGDDANAGGTVPQWPPSMGQALSTGDVAAVGRAGEGQSGHAAALGSVGSGAEEYGHYANMLVPGIYAAQSTKRQTWTTEEDERLRDLVHRIGARKWGVIATYFRNRNAKQCHQR